MYESYKQHLSILQATGKCRKLPPSRQEDLDFSTNDYLGLSHNPEIIAAAISAAEKYGVGATGSRVLSGNNELFTSFETCIAKDKNTEAALIFNTGFQANFSALAALLDPKILGAKPIVFFDRLNHSSLYQAIFLTNPELVRYHHNDMEHLRTLLTKYKHDNRPKFIVAETVFGMDGDILPIENIAAIAREHQAFLYLDEAHATGIFGSSGYGLSTTVDLTDIPVVIMGTFSKALGVSGGYVACSQILKDYLINKASGFIYSTANSPMVVGAASKAWDMVKNLHQERQYLLALSANLRQELLNLGFCIGTSTTHIVPIILGEEILAMRAKEKLLEEGIMVSCIRPPTVPPNSSRIRIALNVKHTKQNLAQLIKALGAL